MGILFLSIRLPIYSGKLESTTGCAPGINSHVLADETPTVQINTRYTKTSTLTTNRHEFGHLHGHLHGQQLMLLMNAPSDKNKLRY